MAKQNPNLNAVVKLPFSYKKAGTLYVPDRETGLTDGIPVTEREAQRLAGLHKGVKIMDTSKAKKAQRTGGSRRSGGSGGRNKPPKPEPLVGTDKHPADVEIAKGLTVPLGEIVAGAYEQSDMSVEDWNAQPQEERDAAIDLEIEARRAEAAAAKAG